MNDNIKKLLETINNNPDLPVVCKVDGEVVGDSDMYWMAQIERSEIGECALYNNKVYEEREEFIDDYYDRNYEILKDRFDYNPCMNYPDAHKRYRKEDIEENKKAAERLGQYLEEIAERAFRRVIIIYIKTPDGIEEFENEKEENFETDI